jgi:hypothetical protein
MFTRIGRGWVAFEARLFWGSMGTLSQSPVGVLISRPGWPGSWKRRVREP